MPIFGRPSRKTVLRLPEYKWSTAPSLGRDGQGVTDCTVNTRLALLRSRRTSVKFGKSVLDQRCTIVGSHGYKCAQLQDMSQGISGTPLVHRGPRSTTVRLTLRYCRRQTEKQAQVPRLGGRKPGAKSFDLHLLQQSRHRRVRQIRLLMPGAWSSWPAWLKNTDPWAPQHILSVLHHR